MRKPDPDHLTVCFVAARVLCFISWVALIGACGGHGTQTSETKSSSTASGPIGVQDSTPIVDSSSVQAAVAVVHDYYDAIEARDYRRAHGLWAGDGAASGKTFEQFAAGFANTAHVTATLGEPSRMDAAAGSRYVEVPVVLRAVTNHGEEQRFAGSYVLRRSVVDGATAAQRRWHIHSATMLPVR